MSNYSATIDFKTYYLKKQRENCLNKLPLGEPSFLPPVCSGH